jgi:hypothetical protein
VHADWLAGWLTDWLTALPFACNSILQDFISVVPWPFVIVLAIYTLLPTLHPSQKNVL